jgi:hypothetical protein
LNFRFCQTLLVPALVVCLQATIPSTFAFNAEPLGSEKIIGEFAAYRDVSVNGDPAASGTALFGVSRIATGWQSSAVITLVSDVRVELLPQSEIRLSITEGDTDCELIAGIVRISAPKGVAVTVRTGDGSVSSNPQSPAMFTVAVTNKTFFSRYTGEVTVAKGSSFHEIPAPGFFRAAVTGPDLARAAPISASGAVNDGLAVMFITVGTVLAAITGLAPARDASFFRRGGS